MHTSKVCEWGQTRKRGFRETGRNGETMSQTAIELIRKIVGLLVAGHYREVVRLAPLSRLNDQSISRAIGEYGRTLIIPPDSAFEHLDIVRVKDASPERYSVRMNLWTVEEGQSDLSIELTVVERAGECSLHVDDIHVL